MAKSYFLKVFNKDDDTLLKTIPAEAIRMDPNFKSQAQSGQGSMKMTVNFPFLDFDEGTVIKHENVVETYLVDENYPQGQLIHKGVVLDYDSYADDKGEGLDMTILGLVSLLSYAHYNDGLGGFLVSHSGEDPADIIKAIIDNRQATTGDTLISYTVSSIATVGVNVSIDFDEMTWLEAIKAVFALISEEGWYWYVDQNGVFYLQQYAVSATHRFTMSKDVVSFHSIKSSKDLVNTAYVNWSGGTQSEQNAPSVSEYRLREKIIEDTTSTDAATADERAAQEVAAAVAPANRFEMTVNSLYNLE